APRAAFVRTPPRRARRWRVDRRPTRPTTGAGTPPPPAPIHARPFPRRETARASRSSRGFWTRSAPDHLGHQRLALREPLGPGEEQQPLTAGHDDAALELELGRRDGGRRLALAAAHLKVEFLQHRPAGALVPQGDRQ